MRKLLLFIFLFSFLYPKAQDTTILVENQSVTLPEVMIYHDLDFVAILNKIKNDTTFYKAFRNLHIIGFSAYNNITMYDKKGKVSASWNSEIIQHHENGCRNTEVVKERTTGDYFDKNGDPNYITGQMYASLFLTKGKVCGENNIVTGTEFSTSGKSGMEKHKEQLKMLFFNPGKRIRGIPFIGNKLDLYDEDAHKLYNYKLDFADYKGSFAYVFTITPKPDLGIFQRNNIVVDEMTTWFDSKTFQVLARNYSLSYKAGIYDFDVKMHVEMAQVANLSVPKILRYKGNFNALFKKREIGEFTATLFDYKR